MEQEQNIYVSYIITSSWSRESSVGIVPMQRTTNNKFSPQIPDQTGSGAHPNSDALDTRSYFSEGKRAET